MKQQKKRVIHCNQTPKGKDPSGLLCNISSPRDSVSLIYPNTEKRVQQSIFDEIQGAWIADETL